MDNSVYPSRYPGREVNNNERGNAAHAAQYDMLFPGHQAADHTDEQYGEHNAARINEYLFHVLFPLLPFTPGGGPQTHVPHPIYMAGG